ncbi:MAG: efflux RND transporter periplasmic adaptor subunit [Pseudomonadota bacterium]
MRYCILAIMLFTPTWLLATTPTPAKPPAPLVIMATITEQDINQATEYVGHVEAIQTVDLRARVEGFLENVMFKEGQDLRAGDLLYLIENAGYQAKLDADQARVAQAQANLDRASQRLKRLKAARVESVRATDMDTAIADAAQTNAQLQEAKAMLASSQLNLGYTRIKAPIDGRIGRTAYTRGNLVNPGSGTLARIVQLDPIRVVYSISENEVSAVLAALNASEKKQDSPTLIPRIKLANNQLLNNKGRIDFVNNEVDPATGTILVRAVYDNHDHRLLPGQYVTVLISASHPRLLPVVPQAAVLSDQKGRYVLMVDENGIAVPCPIKTGPVIDTMWAVESGLKAGDKIIVGNIQKVRPGQPVQIAPAQTKEK